MADWVVIGSGSFYGSEFLRLLREKGETALGMRRPLYDVREPAKMLLAIEAERPRYVVNFAALSMVAESWKHAGDYYLTNVVGLTALADALVGKSWLRKFVQVSTPEVYGQTGKPLTPSTPFDPSTPYAASRAAADMHLLALHRAKGFPLVLTRTVNIYGPGQQPYRIIPRTVLCARLGRLLKLDGGGESERSFIHVRDAARGTLAAALSGREGATYHFATKRMTKIRDLVEAVCVLTGKTFSEVVQAVPDRPGKDMAYLLDDEQSRRELDWSDEISLEQGLNETVAWFSERVASYAHEYAELDYKHRP